MDDRPFAISPYDLDRAHPRYRPARVTSDTREVVPDTKVTITSELSQVNLVATFYPEVEVSGGVNRIAGKQVVNQNTYVPVNFGQDLPIYWMASVFKQRDISANVKTNPYESADDRFTMVLNQQITVSHSAAGWIIPSYPSTEYTVEVGFGIGTGYAAWGYSVICQPMQPVPLGDAGGYEFVQSDGLSIIGDPVPRNEPSWQMAIGGTYHLSFDVSGVGHLKLCER